MPGIAIASDGDVATVAVFTRKPMRRSKPCPRSQLADLGGVDARVVREALEDRAEVHAGGARPRAMLRKADAALVIGDPAFEIDSAKHDVTKIDLGGEWKAMTGLPFVYAMWVGRPGAASPAQCRALQQARDRGLAHLPEIARQMSAGDRGPGAAALAYLRDNLKFDLGAAETSRLAEFHELAAEIGVVPA